MLDQPKLERKMRRCGWAPTDPRFLQVAENIEAVLNAGQELFLANGYHVTSMDAIAAKASVGKMTVYRHFKDKETLFVAIIHRKCNSITDSSTSQPARDLAEAAESLSRFAHSLLDYIGSPEMVALLRMLYGEVSRFPEMGRLFYERGPLKGLEAIKRILTNVVPKDQLGLRAQAFLYMIQGETFQQLLFGTLRPEMRQRRFAKQIEFATQLVLCGLDTSALRNPAKPTTARVVKIK